MWSRWRWHMPLLYARGEQALMEGRHDDAWRHAVASLALASRAGSQKHMARAQCLQGEIMAAQTLRASVRLARRIETPREWWLRQAALGRVLRARRARPGSRGAIQPGDPNHRGDRLDGRDAGTETVLFAGRARAGRVRGALSRCTCLCSTLPDIEMASENAYPTP